jgi:hypothetical protein
MARGTGARLRPDLDGFFAGGTERRLFVHQTRLFTPYRYRIESKSWTPLAISHVEQLSWLGYDAATAPRLPEVFSRAARDIDPLSPALPLRAITGCSIKMSHCPKCSGETQCCAGWAFVRD